MQKLCIGTFLAFALVVAALAGAGTLLLRGGISARSQPSRLEAAVARRARNLLIPGSARDAKNPIPPGAEALSAGRRHFADHCANCHGNDGSGWTEMGRGLYPRPPDLRAAATQGLTDGELFYLIENGIRFTGMPAWGGAGQPEESWKLVHFVRHLPTLGREELHEMERENPRSLHEWEELQEEDAFLRGGAPAGASVHARER